MEGPPIHRHAVGLDINARNASVAPPPDGWIFAGAGKEEVATANARLQAVVADRDILLAQLELYRRLETTRTPPLATPPQQIHGGPLPHPTTAAAAPGGDDDAWGPDKSELARLREECAALRAAEAAWRKKEVFFQSSSVTIDGDPRRADGTVSEYHRISLSACELPTLSGRSDDAVGIRERRLFSSGILRMLQLRNKYVFSPVEPDHDNASLLQFQEAVCARPFEFVPPPKSGFAVGPAGGATMMKWLDGVVTLVAAGEEPVGFKSPPSYEEFSADLVDALEFTNSKVATTVANYRLSMLEANFELHRLVNDAYEVESTRCDPQDFDTQMKVDNHIHAASSMTRREMLTFIREKVDKDTEKVVLETKDGEKTTLAAAFLAATTAGFDIDPATVDLHEHLDNISTETLDVAASAKMFQRFDNFNDSYNPFGKGDLRTIFLKSSNSIDGQYFADILRDVVFKRVASCKSNCAIEPRLSIYGRKRDEWQNLASWVLRHRLLSVDDVGALTGRVKWIIQIPRLANIFMGKCYKNFQELLDNLFGPLFEATLHPNKYPEIHTFLSHVGGIDCVDDESKYDTVLLKGNPVPKPSEYTAVANPPYSYWLYYLSANLSVLNQLRDSRGLNVFRFVPHCGESGQSHHLATAWLVAHGINHGIKLERLPTLQYLYYLDQIPLALAPLSNDSLFLKIKDSPVPRFHRIGLVTCLGTDDPMQFHSNPHPLLEEYTVSAKVFGFTPMDKSEVATYSVKASCFDHRWKARWLGKKYWHGCPEISNNPLKSNLGDIRPHFRGEALRRELLYVLQHGEWKTPADRDSFEDTVDNRIMSIVFKSKDDVITVEQLEEEQEVVRTLSARREIVDQMEHKSLDPLMS
mmetsp:Transcript_7480/g.22076  ORF Transcript_7480/g.22076 Transcript_7480/m.22076 type:complete len:868 (+) Transcript_7480:107-2710(+)